MGMKNPIRETKRVYDFPYLLKDLPEWASKTLATLPEESRDEATLEIEFDAFDDPKISIEYHRNFNALDLAAAEMRQAQKREADLAELARLKAKYEPTL
jgi:hypothetical protein